METPGLDVDAQAAHVAAIRELIDAAESRGIPLWLESGWAIDARLGSITRPHEDIDIAFPQESAAQYRQLIEELGYGGHEFLDYGFLSWRGGVCLDSEPCHRIGGQYSFVDFPAGSCPDDKEGTILGFPVRCVSWEAIYFEILGYIRDIPREQWRPKDFASLRLVEANLDERVKQELEALYRATT